MCDRCYALIYPCAKCLWPLSRGDDRALGAEGWAAAVAFIVLALGCMLHVMEEA